jgi:hypothetical protein
MMLGKSTAGAAVWSVTNTIARMVDATSHRIKARDPASRPSIIEKVQTKKISTLLKQTMPCVLQTTP